MTEESFGRLLYTDCKPGAGRGAGGGFQVQAQSPGVDAGQVRLATGDLLYEVQLPWVNQQLPASDFPLGLAHTGSGGYGTAQGRYLGKAAVGGRMGNHLADCLLTADPGLYGLLRPAQLWRADFWRALPWDGKECPPFDASGLVPGPLGVEEVADWARSAPERGDVLARVVSLLADPGGDRIVIVSDSPDEAVTWIAAATLLLPARRALDVSFKVFSAAPLDARQRVTAAPAALYPKIAVGGGTRRFVLDARSGRCDETPVSESAAFFAGRFTDADEDPYDVLDAVELADALGGDRDAYLTAWALTRPDAPRPEPEALARWLSGATADSLAEHGPAAAALVLSDDPGPVTLRWLDDAVSQKRLAADAGTVRAALLAAELAEIRDGGTPPVEDMLPPASLDPAARRDAESSLSSALLLMASDRKIDLLLSLARRHSITPELAPPLQKRLREFAGSWISHPGRHDPARWALRAPLLDCAHDELRDRLSGDDPGSALAAIKRLNGYFADRADVSDPLDRHIQASLIADPGAPDRIARVTRLTDGIADLARTDGPAPAEKAAEELQRTLLTWDAVDGSIAVALLEETPGWVTVEPAIADRAAARLRWMAARPSRELLGQLADLAERGRVPDDDRLAELILAGKNIRAFSNRARDGGRDASPDQVRYTARLLAHTDPAVVLVLADEVMAALVDSRNPLLASLVLDSLKPKAAQALLRHWAGTVGDRDPVRDGLWSVTCLSDDRLPHKSQIQIATAVRRYANKLSTEEYQQWSDDVRRNLKSRERELLDSLLPRRDWHGTRPRAGRKDEDR